MKFLQDILLVTQLLCFNLVFANCLIFEKQQLLGENFQDAYIDPIAKEKWISAQPDHLRNTARFLADNTKIISRAEYEKGMIDGLTKVLSAIPEGSPKVLLVRREKSGHLWNTRYAQVLIPELRNLDIIHYDEIPAYFRGKDASKKIYAIAIDDVCYSGSQMGSDMHQALAYYYAEHRDNKNIAKVDFHFFRMAGTKVGLNQAVKKSEVEKYGIPLQVSFGVQIPSLGDLPGVPMHNELGHFGAGMARPLTVPFFKAPDSFSYPYVVMDGGVVGASKEDEMIPFIRTPPFNRGEPYRVAPFIHSQLAKPKRLPSLAESEAPLPQNTAGPTQKGSAQ